MSKHTWFIQSIVSIIVQVRFFSFSIHGLKRFSSGLQNARLLLGYANILSNFSFLQQIQGEWCTHVNNPLQKVFKCVYTVYNNQNCTLNHLLYFRQIIWPIFGAKEVKFDWFYEWFILVMWKDWRKWMYLASLTKITRVE